MKEELREEGSYGKWITDGVEEKSTLTLALLDVGVDLVQSSHGDLSDLRVEQQLHQGGGDVFAGRHAGRLGHFTLRGRRREKEGGRGKKRWVRSLIHFISSWETHIFFFFSLQKCKEHHFLYRLNVRRRKPLMNQCWNLSQSKWRYFKGTVHSNDRALVLFADVQTLVQHNKTLAPAN